MSSKVTGSVDSVQVCEWSNGRVSHPSDHIVSEEPLEIRVGDFPVSVTMRTPGSDYELALGFLFSEGLIGPENRVSDLRQSSGNGAEKSSNLVQLQIEGVELDRKKLQRNFFAASGCGLCGKASIKAVRVRGLRPPDSSLRVDPEVLCGLPEKLREAQTIFGQTGGLHSAALFGPSGNLICLREDVGRHNAVDKVIGWALLKRQLPLSRNLLMVSGRGGFELVQKAIAAGVPLMACISAPSSLAVQLAREMGQTLIGFLRGRRFVVYAGEERVKFTE
ncbi:MAG: formate dehydrogenase accessory sulfurtransferase FdhD [Acidobacteria bacterium]|nr:formate dehydrogenase accessory sulfurtransferase FdhD [Acidobacteriota bacterium]